MARKALGLGSTYQGGTGFFYRVAAGIYQAGIEDGIALRAKTNMPLPDPALSRQILGPEINNFDRALRLYMPPGGAKDTLDPMRFVVKAAAMEEYLDQATPDDMLLSGVSAGILLRRFLPISDVHEKLVLAG